MNDENMNAGLNKGSCYTPQERAGNYESREAGFAQAWEIALSEIKTIMRRSCMVCEKKQNIINEIVKIGGETL